MKYMHIEQAVGGQPPRYAPPLSSPGERRSALRRRGDGNVAAVSQGQHVSTPTTAAAWRANTAVRKVAWWPWPLTFWPWKWCPSHVSVPILVFLGLFETGHNNVSSSLYATSCGRHDMLLPVQVDNIFVIIRQVAPIPACWLFKMWRTLRHASGSWQLN